MADESANTAIAEAPKGQEAPKGAFDDIDQAWPVKPGEKKPEPAPAKESDKTAEVVDSKLKTWDTERQKRDEERATQLRDTRQLAEEANKRIAGIEEQIGTVVELVQSLKAGAPKPQEETDELAADDVDPRVAAAIRKSNKALADLRQELSDAKRERAEADNALKQELATRNGKDEQRDGESAVNSILSECSSEFGPGFHNEARAAAKQRLVDDGFDAQNKPPPKLVVRILREEYKRLADAGKAKGPKAPAVDTHGPGAPMAFDQIKAGSLDDVVRQYMAKTQA